jgi:hypothetical protein
VQRREEILISASELIDHSARPYRLRHRDANGRAVFLFSGFF